MRNSLLVCFAVTMSGCVAAQHKASVWDAAGAGRTEEVARLIDHGGQVEDWKGASSALGIAAYYGHEDTVSLLIERGAGIESDPARSGMRPLGLAAKGGQTRIIKLLVAKGADVQSAVDGLLKCAERSFPYISTHPELSEAYNECKAGVERLKPLLASADPISNSGPGAVSPPAKSNPLPVLTPTFPGNTGLDDYAVVIGIEDYVDLPAATYAERDATAAKSFIRAVGVPERNIVILTGNRATKTGMEKTIEAWLPNNVSEKSRVFVFYSGHGAPDPNTGDAYLVPSDGDPQYLGQTGYPLKRLYSKLGELKAKSVVVALDSCFSGAGGRSVLAKGTRPLVGKVDTLVEARGKVSVISASASDQISGADDEAGYGLFTLNFLQGLNGAAKDAQGRVTLTSLYDYLRPRVQDAARRVNRNQVPQLQLGAEDLILRLK